ncbi:hypothetical protein ANN_01041 [Periplaneta americana]|uniref:Uncharacterized protein n=1 Tax=Periplaneta americana TaxID=6978 RepID=A0ABQ8TSJ0_PERAM|nr:hypothetical protein ANN_01041 [Periplaneta americana]
MLGNSRCIHCGCAFRRAENESKLTTKQARQVNRYFIIRTRICPKSPNENQSLMIFSVNNACFTITKTHYIVLIIDLVRFLEFSIQALNDTFNIKSDFTEYIKCNGYSSKEIICCGATITLSDNVMDLISQTFRNNYSTFSILEIVSFDISKIRLVLSLMLD